jgi:hypothetical protein
MPDTGASRKRQIRGGRVREGFDDAASHQLGACDQKWRSKLKSGRGSLVLFVLYRAGTAARVWGGASSVFERKACALDFGNCVSPPIAKAVQTRCHVRNRSRL